MESTPYVVPYSQIKTQRLHFALTMTCGRSPLRAWKTMEPLPADVDEAQPQWVSRRKSNFRRRHRDHANSAMVAAVMASAVVSCQSMITRYSNTRAPQRRIFCHRIGKSGPARYPARMAASPHLFHYRVTYGDCTVGNHIYYGNYLAILEAARGEFFRSLGQTFLQHSEAGVIFPVVECALRYRTPARYDDTVTVETTVTLAKGARLNLAYRILNQRGELVLEAETFHACTSLADKPQRLPASLAERLAPFSAAATG